VSNASPSPSVAGVVAGVIVVLLVGVAIVALIVTLLVVRHRLKRSKHRQDRNLTALENMGYEGKSRME
jgi:Flp pilus assembly protein TadB